MPVPQSGRNDPKRWFFEPHRPVEMTGSAVVLKYSVKKSQRSKARRGGLNEQMPRQQVQLAPPPFRASLALRQKFRFAASSAASDLQITSGDLRDLIVMATGATAANNLLASVRVRQIWVWGPMASDLKPVTVSVEFPQTGDAYGAPAVIVSDTSMGAMRSAFLAVKPPKTALASQWLNLAVTTTPLFQLTFPSDSIVDVSFDLVLQNGQGASSPSAPVSGATAGVVYIRALDNRTGTVLVPIAFPTI